jgi:poly(3-hydroxybutyrate) depolymerase
MRGLVAFLWACIAGLGVFTFHALTDDTEADARRSNRRGAATPGAISPTTYLGTATFGRPWTYTWDARRCTDGIPFGQAPFDPGADAGFTDVFLGYNDASTIGTDADYVCDRSTGGLSEVGLGSALVNQGLSLNGASWVNTALSIPGWNADSNFVIRLLYRHNASASATGRFFRFAAGAAFIEIQATTTGSLQLQLSSTNTYGPTVAPATPALVADAFYIVDVVILDAATVNPRALWMVNGSYIGSTTAVSQPTSFAAITSAGIGSTQTGASVLSGRDIIQIAISNQPDPWYTFETHMEDCRALGLCPTSPSAGCGRTPPCAADAGTSADANVLCPTVSFTSGGVSRTMQMYVPASYDRNTPMTHWRKRCGCTFALAGCLTADPRVDAPAQYLVSIPDPLNTANTDCGAPAQASCNRSVATNAVGNFDLEHELAMIRYVEENYCVDRTWYFGRSNGGMCGYWATSNLGDQHVACVADTIGYMPTAPAINTDFVNTSATPVITLHNRDDTTVGVGLARDGCRWWRGVNDGTRDGGPCVATDGGRFDAETYVDGQVVVGVDGSIPTACAPGGVQSSYAIDGGTSCTGGICCTYFVANDAGPPTRYCECPTGIHIPNAQDEWLGRGFCQAFSGQNNVR